MKAIVFTKYGSPDLLEVQELPTPKAGDDEVLVRIHASSINSWDWEYLNGFPLMNRLMSGLFKPKQGKQRLGADIAGTRASESISRAESVGHSKLARWLLSHFDWWSSLKTRSER